MFLGANPPLKSKFQKNENNGQVRGFFEIRIPNIIKIGQTVCPVALSTDTHTPKCFSGNHFFYSGGP